MARNTCEEKQSYRIELVETRFSYLRKRPSMLPQLDINFHFSCRYAFSEWETASQHIDQPETVLLGRLDLPAIEKTVHVDLMTFMRYKQRETREAIARAFEQLPLSDDGKHRDMIEYAVMRALEIVRSRPADRNVLDLYFGVTVEHDRVFSNRRRNCDPVIGKSEDENECCDRATESRCSICLEELSSGGDDISGMPCSHTFHSRCIAKWLMASSSCPICRFRLTIRTKN